MAGIVYSERLGAISDAQFSAATERAGVGKFLRAAPTTSGLFGQNVFVTTSDGEFVLRGAPHYVSTTPQTSAPPYVRNDLWQFTKEVFFAGMLDERTRAPVPWPQILDEAPDIFGWPYIIMPRMPGTCFDDRSIRKTLNRGQQLAVARALGEALAEQQRLEWPFAGDFDPRITLVGYPGGHIPHLIRETSTFANAARANGALSPDDDAWIERIFANALSLPPTGRPNVYVHGDFKLGNFDAGRAPRLLACLWNFRSARIPIRRRRERSLPTVLQPHRLPRRRWRPGISGSLSSGHGWRSDHQGSHADLHR